MPEPVPVSRVDIDPNFERQLRQLRDLAAQQAEALATGGQVVHDRPTGWDGGPFEYASIHDAFNRDAANEQFLDAVKDASQPGTVGDLIVSTLMIDYLACMERAFKNRTTMTRCRRVAHASGRKAGHGSETGPLTQSALEYARRLVQRSKGAQ